MKNIRRLAVEALLKVDSRDAWSNLALDSEVKKYKLEARDSAFLTALFYGVLERGVTLDACIAAHSKLPLEKLSPAVLEVLRVGVYQLLYMDSVPEHSAVDESVELVKQLRKAQAAGFVNGVLRSFLRSGKIVPVPAEPLSKKLGVEYSCPGEIVGLWLESYGEEFTRRILSASVGRAPLYIRVNTLLIKKDELISRLAAHDVEAREDGGLENCLLLEKAGAVAELPEYKRGFFHVQDKASQICAAALGAGRDMRVLDACAAPGGKTFTIAEIMGGTGELVACDIHSHRVGLISSRAKKMGIKSVKAVQADMTVFSPGLGLFDRVLCDVPCSGLGVIRRKPEIKRKKLEEFAGLPDLQYKILKTSSQYLKDGGIMIYSTCTLNPAENEEVAARFLRENPGFVPVPLSLPTEAGAADLFNGETMRTFAGELDADGFFMAAFRRRE